MAQRCELCTYWRRDATLAQKCSRAKCGGVSVRQVIIELVKEVKVKAPLVGAFVF